MGGWGVRGAALGVGICLALLAVSTPAAAAIKPITGKLSKPGYTVIALAENGKASSTQPKGRKFKLRPPAKVITLHLRAEDGTYAGPIVVGRQGKKAIVGVKAGAKLRKVKVLDGYAKVAKKLPKKSLDKQAKALAENKIPIGAGNFGHVAVAELTGPGSDRDLDGIPAPLDIDDDGDLILDPFDGADAAAQISQVPTREDVGARSSLALDLSQTVNANATGFDLAQVDDRLQKFGRLTLGALNVPFFPGADVELDCGDPDTGLIYCRGNGSTGRIDGFLWPNPPGVSNGDPFPSCCDRPPADGMGSLVQPSGPIALIELLHGARSDQVFAGQMLRVSFGSAQELWGTVSYVFVTVPALVSYTDEAGTEVPVSYPVAPGAPGTQQNPFVVPDDDGDGDVQVALTFWRPQRKALPNEAGDWKDLGHTVYGAHVQGPTGGYNCREFAYSAPTGLIPASQLDNTGNPRFGLLDESDDQTPDPDRKLGFTLDLTKCQASAFDPSDPGTFNSGDVVAVTLRAQPENPLPGPPDVASTTIWFKRQ
jgi:hypothetical protein